MKKTTISETNYSARDIDNESTHVVQVIEICGTETIYNQN